MTTNTNKKGIQPGTIVILLVIVGAIISGTIMAVLLATSKARTDASDTFASPDEVMREALAAMTIPEFRLTDQLGRPTDRSVFEGKWTVLEFMFTACVTACPVMKGNLFSVQQELGDLPVRFVSITVDPEHDTPEHLRSYSSRFEVDPDKWRFLTGDMDTILSICEEGLGFGVQVDPAVTITRPSGDTMANITHPSRFFVVSPEVRIVAMYDGLDREDALRMGRDLKRFTRTGSY